MNKISITKAERSYLINNLMNNDMGLSDTLNKTETNLKDNLILDNSDPTNQEVKDHKEFINGIKKEIKDLNNELKLNSDIIKKVRG